MYRYTIGAVVFVLGVKNRPLTYILPASFFTQQNIAWMLQTYYIKYLGVNNLIN